MFSRECAERLPTRATRRPLCLGMSVGRWPRPIAGSLETTA